MQALAASSSRTTTFINFEDIATLTGSSYLGSALHNSETVPITPSIFALISSFNPLLALPIAKSFLIFILSSLDFSSDNLSFAWFNLSAKSELLFISASNFSYILSSNEFFDNKSS